MNEYDFNAMAQLPDANARYEAFCTVLMHEINTDDEPWRKKGYTILRALARNDANDVILSLCGWTPQSVAKAAGIIRDPDETFHSDSMPATLCAEWEDDTLKSTVCYIDPKTFEVTDIAFDDLEGKEFADAKILTISRCIHGETLEFCCRFAETADEVDNYTYWVNPNSANKKCIVSNILTAEFRHISELKRGDMILLDGEDEVDIVATNATLTNTSLGKEWNVELVTTMPYPKYLYASEVTDAKVAVVIEQKTHMRFSDASAKYEFVCVPDLENYADSMLHDSDTEVASIDYEAAGIRIEVSLMVRGEVLVYYSGLGWKKPSCFPQDLRNLIKKYPNHWPEGAASEGVDVHISNNNWFEYIVNVVRNGETVLSDGYICEDNLESMTHDELKTRMVELCEKFAN